MKYSHIDIFDINVVYQMQFDNPPHREIAFVKVVFERLQSITKFIFSFRKEETIKANIDVLFFGASTNNQRSFQSIYDNIKGFTYTSIRNDNDFPISQSLYLSLPYFWSIIFRYIIGSSEQRQLLRKYPFEYLFTYGKYIVATKMLKSYSPKLLVLANDHSPQNRCLLHAANELNVRTIYIQHASVSNKFPKLTFDYSLLDGQESFDKYGQVSKKNSKILLTGGTRYDYFYKKQLVESEKKIGISINQFDDFEIVKTLCLNLKKLKEYKIAIRPHPNMKNWNRNWFEAQEIEYSDSSSEPSNQFLSKLEIQISNICGIHLDAVILGIATIQFQLSKKAIYDQYLYVSKGLIKKANNMGELLNYIHNRNELYPNNKIVQYFMASAFTSHEGKVGLFLAEYINAILTDVEQEKKIESEYKIQVYNF
ncbi:MAG: hypothetical protein IPM32_16925 [Ignavibacteriae bacterium]|nr:hypothetical protein [Ignavibacteriota bacterium]